MFLVLISYIQNLNKPIDLLQRFTFGIWAPHWHLRQPSCRRPSRQNWLLRPNVVTLPAALLAKIGSFAQCGDSSGFNIVFVPCSRFPLLLLGVRHILTRAKSASSLSDNPSSWVRHILTEAKAASPLSGDLSAVFDGQESVSLRLL